MAVALVLEGAARCSADVEVGADESEDDGMDRRVFIDDTVPIREDF